jgi:ParB family chromosome partitioning protein
MTKPALGRGLGALMGGAKPSPAAAPASPAPVGTGVQKIAWDRIKPSPFQPRKDFTDEALKELADSIREQGIVQPLIVRAVGDGFELIAGERRWRAAQLAGLKEVPIIERTATDREVLELALIENLQRENLNPIEEAQGYLLLQTQFTLTQEQIAQKVGRGRVVVANSLRLLKLPVDVQTALRENRLSVGHAKALLSVSDPLALTRAAAKILRDGLTVRQTEAMLARPVHPESVKPGASSKLAQANPHIADLESKLRELFAAKVSVRYKSGKGAVEIHFSSDDDLNRVIDILGINLD